MVLRYSGGKVQKVLTSAGGNQLRVEERLHIEEDIFPMSLWKRISFVLCNACELLVSCSKVELWVV